MSVENMVDCIHLVGGLIILIYSGDFLVKGAVNIARHLNISTLIIGLTVVAFGTSAPELFVSVDAILDGESEISLGNVIGSNISNIALVLGLTTVILPMPVVVRDFKKNWPIMFLSGGMLYLFMMDHVIEHWEGGILFLMIICFILFSIYTARKDQNTNLKKSLPPEFSLGIAITLVVLASVGLAWGSDLLVKGASSIAERMGVSKRIISLTIVAFGTSLPELTASMVAAFKKESEISVGNIVGSNIFNVFAVIGITGIVKPIEHFQFNSFKVDLIFMLAIYICLFFFVIPNVFQSKNNTQNQKSRIFKIAKGKISRFEGIIFVSIYVFYLITIL